MRRFKKSIILMGIDWSNKATKKYLNEVKIEDPQFAKEMNILDRKFAKA